MKGAHEDYSFHSASRSPLSPAFAFDAPEPFDERDMEADFDIPDFSSMELPDSSVAFEDQTRNFDARSVAEASSSSRPFQMLSSPPTSVDKFTRASRKLTPGPGRHGQDARAKTPEYHSCQGSEDSHFDERGLPSVIRLPKSTDRALQRRSSVYGTLFTYPDPWSVIGEILSQEAPGQSQEVRNLCQQVVGGARMRNQDSEWTMSLIDNEVMDEVGDEDQSHCEEPMHDDLFDELDFEDEPADPGLSLDVPMGGEVDGYDDVEAMFGVEEPIPSPNRTDVPDRGSSLSVERSLLANGVQSESDSPGRGSTYWPFDELLEDLGLSPRRHEGSPISKRGTVPALDDKVKLCEEQEIEVARAHKSPVSCALEIQPADPQSTCCSASATPEDSGEAAIIEAGPCATGSSDTLNLLEVPELEERNGKWIGPTLFFNDDDEDEDEF